MLSQEETRALLGKRVEVTLVRGSIDGSDAIISRGQFLGFGDGGEVEILEDDGFVHHCWPMLDIREVPSA